MTDEQTGEDKGWCVLELMGHRKLAGYITDDKGLLRIDVHLAGAEQQEFESAPGPEDSRIIATQWYGAGAIYCITATTRENCLALTRSHQPAPIGRWELPERVSIGGRLGEDREIDDADEVEGDY